MAHLDKRPAPPATAATRLLPWLAWLAGAALVGLGSLCIGAYVHTVLQVWNSSDRSLIYWQLILPALGIGLIGAGASLVAIGWRARRGDRFGLMLARRSLLALAALVAIVGLTGHVQQQRAAAERREILQATHLHDDRQQRARRIERFEVDVSDPQRLALRTDLSGGLDGRYRWTLTVSTTEGVLHRESRLLQLHGPAAPITDVLAFDALFADCFAADRASAVYACVKGAGAGEIYTVAVALELVEDARGALDTGKNWYGQIASKASTELRIDTMTTQREVIVQHVQKL